MSNKKGNAATEAAAPPAAEQPRQPGAIARFNSLFDKNVSSLEQLAIGHLDIRRVKQIVVTMLASNPDLRLCTTESLLRCVRFACEVKLYPGSVNQHVWIIPYKNTESGQLEAQFQLSAKGFIEILTRPGTGITDVVAEPIYEKDLFEHDQGTGNYIKHVKTFEAEPGKLIGAYVIFYKEDGSYKFHLCPAHECEKARKKSKAPNSPAWRDNASEMYVKVTIKQGAKRQRLTGESARALQIDNREESTITDEDAIDTEYRDLTDEEITAADNASTATAVSEEIKPPEAEGDKPRWSVIIERFGLTEAHAAKVCAADPAEALALFENAVAAQMEIGRYLETFEDFAAIKAAIESDLKLRRKSDGDK